ncbi:antA/AntB antirepressor family protein [Mesoterricola silvestris]|uniref:Phage antirepressor Ant n=1 Tax=Mesoterricola silvestris TaxID=2927979 RepID=A0AA48GKD2_9BACT|nr:antA/AntB antirepressor family protein [Mesoterricola silvestris]BDU72942.1 hypothetical protein METEAL_21160 [Mesoterricola silvestris]
MNAIHTEEFNLHAIRGISRDGRPWVVAHDAATILNFPNPMEAVEVLCPERVVVTIPTSNGGQNLTIIHMRDLFRLTEKSLLRNVDVFIYWVEGFAQRVVQHPAQPPEPKPWIVEDPTSAPRDVELIPITASVIAGVQVNAVNARDLHRFLEVGKDFSNWIKDRIEAYGFQEHRDYEVFANFGDNPQGGRPAREYALTLDMAKELSMVERNARGKQARAYFIECERRALAPAPEDPRIPKTLPDALRLAAQLEESRAALETRVQVLEPKAAFADAVAISTNHQDLDETARALGWGVLGFYAQLRDDRILMKKDHREHLPYQEWIDAGYFVVKEGTYQIKHTDGRKEVKNYLRTMVTGKGQQWLQAKYTRRLVNG